MVRQPDSPRKFEKIRTFKPEEHTENPKGVRDNLASQIREAYDDYFDIVFPIVSYGRSRGEDLKEIQKKAIDSLLSIEGLKADFDNKQRQIITEMENILGQVRDSAGKIGVTKYAAYFKEEAGEHEERAKNWLNGTIFLTVLTIFWGAATFAIHPAEGYTNWYQVFQYSVPKVIILTGLLYSLVWASSNFRSHRHNYVTNKHRQNSLSTFEAFVAAAGDDTDTKNAVLLQATQSIFATQSTGYAAGTQEGDVSQKVIEIFRGARDSGGGD